jgi:protein-S-isoprenylcysteine O-methyltransferase Ste14
LFSIGFAIHSAIAGNPFVWHLIALAVWNWIYYKRALTEELHLARTDPEYLTYMQEVPYRFIPKII